MKLFFSPYGTIMGKKELRNTAIMVFQYSFLIIQQLFQDYLLNKCPTSGTVMSAQRYNGK